MTYILFRYIIFHIFVLVTILVFSRKLSIVHKKYWKIAFVPILIYAIEEGFRWGRDSDWWGYRATYNLISAGFDVNNEILFKYFWKLLCLWGFEYPVAIFLATLLFIFSLFFLLKYSKQTLFLSLPLFVIWLAPLSIQLIRWFMGLSICFIGLKYLFDNSYKKHIYFYSVAFLYIHLLGYCLRHVLFFIPS